MTTLAISMPKAGTYLFAQMLQCDPMIVLDNKPKEFLKDTFLDELDILDILVKADKKKSWMVHLPYNDIYEKVVMEWEHVVLVMRDPLDCIVSMAHYIDRLPGSVFNCETPGGRLSDFMWDERIDYLIEHYRAMAWPISTWATKSYVQKFYYEDFVHDRERLFDKLEHMGYGTHADFEHRAKEHGFTWNNGRTGDWLSFMTVEQQEEAMSQYHELRKRMMP